MKHITGIAGLLLAQGCLLFMGACTLGGPLSVPPAPAPLTHTIIDEQALTLASQTVDVLALSASALVKNHVITPGSPAALKLADGIDRARTAINAAALAREAGNSKSYAEALTKARAAIAQVRSVLNPEN